MESKSHTASHHIVDVMTSPQVSLPTTGAAWVMGQVTAEQWLTYLSIAAVVVQLCISLPKVVYGVYRFFKKKRLKRRRR